MEVEKGGKGKVLTFVGADANSSYVMVTAWNSEVESISQQIKLEMVKL